ncbi:MAG: hypothetical protein WC960_05430 [Bacteroidales bacterium]
MRRISIKYLVLLSFSSLLLFSFRVPLLGQTLLPSTVQYEPLSFVTLPHSGGELFTPQKGGFNLSYSRWLPSTLDATVLYGRGFYNLSQKFGVSLGYTNALLKPYNIIDDQGVDRGPFTPNEFMVEGGASLLIFERLAATLNLKYINSDLGGPSVAHSFAGDLSLLYGVEKWRLGLKLGNVGTPLDWGVGPNSLPTYLELFSSYLFKIASKHSLLVAGRGVLPFGSLSPLVAGGLEYSFAQNYFFRAGGNYSWGYYNLPPYLSFGIGVKLLGINLDFSYLKGREGSPIYNTLSLGLGYSF